MAGHNYANSDDPKSFLIRVHLFLSLAKKPLSCLTIAKARQLKLAFARMDEAAATQANNPPSAIVHGHASGFAVILAFYIKICKYASVA